jgi:hypothetical protein
VRENVEAVRSGIEVKPLGVAPAPAARKPVERRGRPIRAVSSMRSGQLVIRSTLRSLGRELGAVSSATSIPQDLLKDFVEERTLLPPQTLRVLTAHLFSGTRVFDDCVDQVRPSVRPSIARGVCRVRQG